MRLLSLAAVLLCALPVEARNRWRAVNPVPAAPVPVGQAADALDALNATRAARGLRPYLRDDGLTAAAKRVCVYRAERGIAGHVADFSFLPAGSTARVAGCAAWPVNMGWGACATYDNYTYAGAAWVVGRDGKRYMHLFAR